MPKVTLSSKHQITLPVEIVRVMGLKPGDKLIAEALDWRIVIMKESENRLERYIGSLKGVYGSTKEEIDRYVWNERDGPERQEWLLQFYDIMQRDDDAKAIIDWLLERPGQKCGEKESDNWWEEHNWAWRRLEDLRQKLLAHGGLRQINSPEGRPGSGLQYYLVPDVVEYLRSKVLA